MMSSIKPEQIAEFRRYYNALLNESRHQYSQPIVRELGTTDTGRPIEQLDLDIEYGLDITVMRQYFHQLIIDAELGREIRSIHYHHPVVAQAYNEYLILLNLTRNNANN
jgi:hypothetical protein